jgi:ribonucleases P/MRP protein subunit RPP40
VRKRQHWRLVDDTSNLVPVSSGTPQGSILSALLFSLYINDLSEAVSINLHLYTDDSQIYCSSPLNSSPSCFERMNEELVKVKNWANLNSVVINAKKSQAIVIAKKETSFSPSIKIGNDEIPLVNKVVSLGLTLNCSLSWYDHINKICGEIFGGLGMLRQTQFITPIETKKRLIQSLLILKILYCSNIFSGCSRASWDKKS